MWSFIYNRSHLEDQNRKKPTVFVCLHRYMQEGRLRKQYQPFKLQCVSGCLPGIPGGGSGFRHQNEMPNLGCFLLEHPQVLHLCAATSWGPENCLRSSSLIFSFQSKFVFYFLLFLLPSFCALSLDNQQKGESSPDLQHLLIP